MGSPYAILRHCSEVALVSDEASFAGLADGSGGEVGLEDEPSNFRTTIHSCMSVTRIMAVMTT